MALSIVIVSWNVKEYLRKCLTSIFLHLKNVDFQVIVVDNGSVDGTSEMIGADFPQIKLIVNKKNFGFAKANNQGIKEAAGEYVLILNPDTEFIDDSVILFLNYLKNNPNVGAVGCQLLNSDKSVQPSVRRFPTLGAVLAVQLKLPYLFRIPAVERYLAHDFDYEKIQEADQVMGAFILLPKFIFSKINLFDERFFVWFEEVDLCQRIKQAGYLVIYNPSVKIIHYGSQSFKQVLSLKKQLIWNQSVLHYFKKHRTIFEWLILWLVQPLTWALSAGSWLKKLKKC